MPSFKQIPDFDTETYNRFWSKVAFTANPNMCWEWTSTIKDKKKPYGTFDIKGQTFTAHRLAYFSHYKVDPKDLHTLHKCDNPKCCNPVHLFLGTNSDNIADKVSKGRQARNEAWNKGQTNDKIKLWKNYTCKASESDFELMKEMYLQGNVTISSLVLKFGVCKRTIAKWLRSNGIFVPSKYTTLTKEQVLEIRSKYIPNIVSSSTLAKEYGVGGKTILDIVHKKTWTNI